MLDNTSVAAVGNVYPVINLISDTLAIKDSNNESLFIIQK